MREIVKPILNIFKDDDIYITGSTVRDLVLNIEPKDLNFTINLDPYQIEKKLNTLGYKTWKIDKNFSTIGTKLGSKNVEISTFKGSNIEEDLSLRDFTFNAMAVRNGKIIDPYGGIKDIDKQLIKCVNSPPDMFSYDPLCMLRAIRFVSTLGFRIDENTKYSITSHSHSILITSKERWFDELTKLLLGKNVKPSLELLFKTRLLGYILPEVYPITMIQRNQNSHTKDLWYHTKIVVNKSKPTPIIRWSALLHDIAKPQTMIETPNGIHFFQHEYLGSEIVDSLFKRLKVSSSFSQSVKGLITLHQRIGDVVNCKNNPPVSINAFKRLSRDCDERKCKLEDLINLFSADCSSNRKDVIEKHCFHVKLLYQALKEIREEDLKPKLPKGIGNKIMEYFDLDSGHKVGEIKRKLNFMLISGKIKSDMKPEEMFKLLDL